MKKQYTPPTFKLVKSVPVENVCSLSSELEKTDDSNWKDNNIWV